MDEYDRNYSNSNYQPEMHYHSEEFNNAYLNEDKKAQIIKSLEDEIQELRAKYFLKQPNDVKKIRRVESNSRGYEPIQVKEEEMLNDVVREDETLNHESCLLNSPQNRFSEDMNNRSRKYEDGNVKYVFQPTAIDQNLFASFGKREDKSRSGGHKSDDFINKSSLHNIKVASDPSSYVGKSYTNYELDNEDNEVLLEEGPMSDEEEKPRDLDQEISMSMNQSYRETLNNSNYNIGNSSNPKAQSVKSVNHSNHEAVTDQGYYANQLQKNRNEIASYQNMKNVNQSTKANNSHFNKLSKESNIKYKSKSKEKFNKIKEEAQKKFDSEHTFQPKVNYTFNKSQATREYGGNEDMINRLATPKLMQINERLKHKEDQERLKMQVECTFQPSISSTSRNIVSKKAEHYSQDFKMDSYNNSKPGLVNERLFKISEQLREKREKLKREYEENIEKEYSFTPTIHENSKNLMKKYHNQQPIHVRYNEIQANKRECINQIKIHEEAAEKSKFNNFNPRINRKSKEIANRRLDLSVDNAFSKNCNERLYEEAKQRRHNSKNNRQNIEENSCTFKPQLFYSTLNPEGNGNIDDFLNRQKLYEDLKKERLEKRLSKSISHSTREFQPRINTTSDILMRADHERAQENFSDKIDRLYRKNYEKIQKRKQNLQDFYNNQNTFKPKINELSKLVGRPVNFDELAKNKESEKVRQYKEQATSSSFNDCTFKPQLNSNNNYKSITSNYKIDENTYYRIEEELKQKQQKLEILKDQLDQVEIAEANFQPKLNSKVPSFQLDQPLILKGYSKHIEQMEKARKAKIEKEERERKVFISGQNWSRDNLVTIPQPFQLSYMNVNSKGKRDDIAKKMKDSENKECTFKPVTNESANKEIIKMILKG